ncbi:hypothetical protein GCM10010123_16560 [Pilimelia anulata]|uniref:Lipoprotein n=1 Tax=Pilimelia anulata TaxID=53371 RepID=A0A8J3F7C9_9ACTN|nr:hypothetical protein [Pilimelia anulata]GGJ87670.1 hypothetical protein GCM10010123_16560 [Pilimelia anulata]
MPHRTVRTGTAPLGAALLALAAAALTGCGGSADRPPAAIATTPPPSAGTPADPTATPGGPTGGATPAPGRPSADPAPSRRPGGTGGGGAARPGVGPGAPDRWLCTWERLWLAEQADPATAAQALKKVEEFRTKPGYQQLDGPARQSLDDDIAKARKGDGSGFRAYVDSRC